MTSLMKHFLKVCLIATAIVFVARGCAVPAVETAILDSMGMSLSEEVVLPTRMCGDYFIVEALVDGQGPFPFLLDTGAGTTVISPLISDQADVSRRIDSLAIGGLQTRGNMPCKVQDITHISRALGTRVEGILAYGVFEDVLLTYDYPRQEIRVQLRSFTDAELAQDNVVPTSDGTRPFINAAADGVKFTALIDTGASGRLSFNKLDRFSFEEQLVPTGARMRINGLFIVKAGRLAGDLRLGPLTLHEPIINSSVSTNLIGQEVLRDFVITFDQQNHRVRFDKPGGEWGTPLQTPPLYGIGIASAPRDDHLIVRRVFEGSAAEQGGLLVDDNIIAIDDVAIADRGCSHLEFKPEDHPRQTKYLLERAGESMTITFPTDVLVK